MVLRFYRRERVPYGNTSLLLKMTAAIISTYTFTRYIKICRRENFHDYVRGEQFAWEGWKGENADAMSTCSSKKLITRVNLMELRANVNYS